MVMSQQGKTTCKEISSTCQCTVVEKPICCKEKKECVATIVGVLSLPESFCKRDSCEDTCEEKKDECCDPCEEQNVCGEEKKDTCCEEEDECIEVYRDLGECITKAIKKTSKTC